MNEIIIGAGIIVLTQLVKNKIYPRFGATGVQVFIFILALIGVGIQQYALANAEFGLIVTEALKYLAGAITIYEVILKKIGFKSADK